MFFVGLDLGKRLDYSAIAVAWRALRVERRFQTGTLQERDCPERRGMVVRHLERIRLGTPYTEVVNRVLELLERLQRQDKCRLAVDATGVGMPVVDMLQAARLQCEFMPVLITGGAGQHAVDGVWHVPKVDLLAGLQAALETGDLQISRKMRETPTLVRELLDVRVRVRGSGAARLAADGFGQHDDLVIAVALACWAGRRKQIGMKSEAFRLD